ncbi:MULTISPECIES: phosphopantetheine-binding protein [unclassified Streptomyces]|uniref:phosphopantetheine-binding protein n=1 Tax=unclassified Streptomyces TaxID=2593676 RepID=UPI002257BE00|nr:MULTISPECIES: phosphopantetheine-binding protein [unclassified Streptomyces]MCX4409555.1 phosphopantetheine-binding protein [Streptomyces sp. NBC_01764]MCX5191326.1 phosphopantetheine-binding protein [Streptomyces sp. NBC_00268]
MSTHDNNKPAIRAFLARFFGEHRLADDENIFATGLVNSLFVMQLVLFVEGEFSLTVADEDLEMENFTSIATIDALVRRYHAASARC